MNSEKILLVSPPNQLMKIETPRPNPELGLLYLAGALEDAGFHADILDATVGTRDDRWTTPSGNQSCRTADSSALA